MERRMEVLPSVEVRVIRTQRRTGSTRSLLPSMGLIASMRGGTDRRRAR